MFVYCHYNSVFLSLLFFMGRFLSLFFLVFLGKCIFIDMFPIDL